MKHRRGNFRLFVPALAVLSLLLSSRTPVAAIDRAHYQELTKELRERAKQKDWQGSREVLAKIGRELPVATPRYLLMVASIEAHLGHKTEALDWLQRFAATGLSYELEKDNDLKGLLNEPVGQQLAAEMKKNSKPVMKTEFVCSLPQADTMPEDIAYVKSSGSFIVSSVRHHTLYRVTLPKAAQAQCSMEELSLSAEVKRWPILAVSFDPQRKVLWATASAMPGFSGFPKEDEGKALLLEIDPETGKLLRSFSPSTQGPAVLGDMCVTEDGTVYVTDSIGGGVYRLRGDLQKARLEKIADGLFSPQTPAPARDGRRLFVADYTMGVAVIDLPSSGQMAKVSYLPHSENIADVALDGLYLDGDSLIGIQNGTDPIRILRLQMDHAQTKIIAASIIEQSSERMGDPTHAVLVNGWFYVSANVGWSNADDNTGELKQGASFTSPVLLRFRALTGSGQSAAALH
jgi:sugar lactone lactonase YvrE